MMNGEWAQRRLFGSRSTIRTEMNGQQSAIKVIKPLYLDEESGKSRFSFVSLA